MRYQLTAAKAVRRINDDGTDTWVPFSKDYRAYIEYLAWLDAGNKPEAAPKPSVPLTVAEQ